jgi:hypothetical protein
MRHNKLPKADRLEAGHWYRIGMGTMHMYIIRAERPTTQGNGTFLVQYTDQIRFASKSDRIVSAQGITVQRSWTETLNNALYEHFPYTPTEEDLHESIAAIFLTDKFSVHQP